MADIDFPESLPGPLYGTLEEPSTDPWVQDASEVGARRRRKRFTRTLRQFSFQMRLTTAQKELLLAFYDVDLDDGVNAFIWTHPESAVVYEVRFSGRPAPKNLTIGIWDVPVTLEEI